MSNLARLHNNVHTVDKHTYVEACQLAGEAALVRLGVRVRRPAEDIHHVLHKRRAAPANAKRMRGIKTFASQSRVTKAKTVSFD